MGEQLGQDPAPSLDELLAHEFTVSLVTEIGALLEQARDLDRRLRPAGGPTLPPSAAGDAGADPLGALAEALGNAELSSAALTGYLEVADGHARRLLQP